MFKYVAKTHDQNTRTSTEGKLIVPRTALKKSQGNFRCRGASYYNELDSSIKEAPRLRDVYTQNGSALYIEFYSLHWRIGNPSSLVVDLLWSDMSLLGRSVYRTASSWVFSRDTYDPGALQQMQFEVDWYRDQGWWSVGINFVINNGNSGEWLCETVADRLCRISTVFLNSDPRHRQMGDIMNPADNCPTCYMHMDS